MSGHNEAEQQAVLPATVLDLLPALGMSGDLSDDAVLKLTKALRVEALRDLHKNGTLSGEGADRNFFLGIVAGLDSQAVNNKKISADQKANNSNAALMAEIIARVNPTMFSQGAGSAVDVEAMVLPASIPDVVAVPGERDVDPGQLDYESFVAKNEALAKGLPPPAAKAASSDDDY